MDRIVHLIYFRHEQVLLVASEVIRVLGRYLGHGNFDYDLVSVFFLVNLDIQISQLN